MLNATGLSVGERLRALDFHAEPGEHIAILGPNGAGKSTLLAALAGLLPAKGRIEWNDREYSKIPFLQRGRMLSWLGQESHAEFAFPVREVVAQGRHAWGDDGACVEEAMATLDITHLAERPITQLSGGERRRVFLARALATGAPIQLWDEPASSLDVRHALEVYRLGQQLAAKGSTLLVSLHDIRAAYRFSRVLVLECGHLVGDGPPHEVLSAKLIREVFRVEASFVTSLVPELPQE
ncbi:MAG: ABC transporter ATP-binding protein [Holophaga sp.]|nr:ABC transporter ATP-binding protein [Holophaga sp.]